MTDILLVTWQRPDITQKTLTAIKNNTGSPYRLIVFDNGSDRETVEILKTFHQKDVIDELILNKTNIGLEPARNYLLAIAESEYVVTTDSDCLPMPPDEDGDWLYKLTKLMDYYPEYAAIGSRTQVMIGTGNIFEEADVNGDEIVEFGHPGGSLRIMRAEAVRKVGAWRNQEAGRGSEERYICGLLREDGWKTGFATQVKCLHLFGDRGKATDRWGYPADWLPSATGHSDIWHPVLENGDDPEEVARYLNE